MDFCICSHIAHKSHSVYFSHARKFVWIKKKWVVHARITSSDLFSYAINKTHFRLMTSAIVCIFMKNSHADSVSDRTFVIYQCCCQKMCSLRSFFLPETQFIQNNRVTAKQKCEWWQNIHAHIHIHCGRLFFRTQTSCTFSTVGCYDSKNSLSSV